MWRKGVWRKGTRRIGAQQKGFAGLLCGAQGLTPGKRKILGTGSIRGETLKSFLRSGRLKSCFGEHDFSQDFALPGRKSLRSAKQSPREALLLHPDPPLGLPGVGGGEWEEAVGLPGVGGGEEAVGLPGVGEGEEAEEIWEGEETVGIRE
ncbi:hypothetical protein [Enterocloster lavalensis]|uniref:hypothetical protein n=1 Tax=Enterocloster lavalensis TaxID=460384 RepID=UPI001D0793E8|nr:hypothetical protein [Enterocloster lavalensis]MCB6341424.1 hypothetical protein [Enterocloster lavalensis]